MNFKTIAIVSAAVILLGLIFILWSRGNPTGETDRIYTNVYIHGVSVGGMTRDEAEAALMERFNAGLASRTIKFLKNEDVAAEFSFADFGARFDFSPLVDDALEYTHKPNFSRRMARMFKREYSITTSPIFIFSAERFEDIMKDISQTLDIPAKNASFSEENGQIVVAAESVGLAVDIEAASAATRKILNSLSDGEVELAILAIEPLYTRAHFDFKASLLGGSETACNSPPSDPRRRNIARAAERIHNTVIYPGEVFSAGEIIAAHLPNSGYEKAVVLVRGEPSEDVGGGVCQVVTTLYNAALYAELEIVQRHNHSAQVSYAAAGFDATVAGDYFDLKFKNNTAHPILITSRVQNSRLYVRIYGNETRDARRTIRFEARQIELLTPEPYREVIDPQLPRGQSFVTLESQIGYHVELYKLVYQNGRQVEETKINSSVYRPLQGIISIGAG
jgi:vancomycin resistance protein YoaR